MAFDECQLIRAKVMPFPPRPALFNLNPSFALMHHPRATAGRSDAFTRVSDHVATLIGVRAGAAVIPLRG